MGGNPLTLVFLAIGLLFLLLIVVLAVFQKRVLAEQARQVNELLVEAREMAETRRGESDVSDEDEARP